MARFVKFDTANRTVTFPVKSITSIEMTPITIPAGYREDYADPQSAWIPEDGEMAAVNVTINIVGNTPLKFRVDSYLAEAFEGWVTKQHADNDYGQTIKKEKVFPINECDFI